jgi:TPR repeat protein
VPQNDVQAARYYEAALLREAREAREAFEPLLNLYLQKHIQPKDDDVPKRIAGLITRGATARQLYLVGELHRQGVVLPKDPKRAAELFSQAATLGSPDAQTRLGQFWQAGLSGQVDVKEAVRWFRKAAMQGSAEAQFLLGHAYAEGDGVEKEIVAALKWTILSARQGHTEARALQQKLEAGATPQQIESARNQADNFQPPQGPLKP